MKDGLDYKSELEYFMKLNSKQMDKNEIEQIARVCYDALKVYCQTLGENTPPEWVNLPISYNEKYILGVQEKLKNRFITAETLHNLMKCNKPYEELPFEQKVKYYIILNIVEAFAVAKEIELD